MAETAFRVLVLCAVAAFFLSLTTVSAKGLVRTVVIDAGHGGHDSGCLGRSGVKEKDVALGIALKLGAFIEDHFPAVKVVYTRKSDVFVELHERAQIANNAHADLFICIHCNSACYYDKKRKKEMCNQEPRGPETYIMGLHRTGANLDVARRENSVVVLEKDYKSQYEGFDPNSPEADIIFSLYQNTFMDQSLDFATAVQNELSESGRYGRGVKQAGFLVLYKTAMPSVLIETGFLSNPSEEKFLGSPKGQQEVASDIYKAFKSYHTDLERSGSRPASAVKESEQDQPAEDTSQKESLPSQSKEVVADPPVFLSIQIITSSTRLDKESPRFKGVKEVWEEKTDKAYKYHVGHFKTMDAAVESQSELRSKGFKDAFVVAFKDHQRIPVPEARELLKKDTAK